MHSRTDVFFPGCLTGGITYNMREFVLNLPCTWNSEKVSCGRWSGGVVGRRKRRTPHRSQDIVPPHCFWSGCSRHTATTLTACTDCSCCTRQEILWPGTGDSVRAPSLRCLKRAFACILCTTWGTPLDRRSCSPGCSVSGGVDGTDPRYQWSFCSDYTRYS